MISKLKYIIYFVVVSALYSCDYFTVKNTEKTAIARVEDNFLYKEDLVSIFSKNLPEKDSIIVAQNYINNWVKQQLLLSKARINLAEDTDKFEELVKKYRQDLYINSYKQAVVSQYLDTAISDYDIDEFYRGNGDNFKLNEALLKLKYIRLGKDILNQRELIELFRSDKKEDLDSLQARELFLKGQHLNDSTWIKLSDFLNRVSAFSDDDRTELLKKDNFLEKEDSIDLYLVVVKDFLRRNDPAPKSYITPTIKQMILHQRKLQLLRNIEETLLDDAKDKQLFEIY